MGSLRTTGDGDLTPAYNKFQFPCGEPTPQIEHVVYVEIMCRSILVSGQFFSGSPAQGDSFRYTHQCVSNRNRREATNRPYCGRLTIGLPLDENKRRGINLLLQPSDNVLFIYDMSNPKGGQ